MNLHVFNLALYILSKHHMDMNYARILNLQILSIAAFATTL